MSRRYYGMDVPLSTGPHPDQLADHLSELVEALELARSRLWACNPPVEDHVEERIDAVLAKVKGETK